MKSDVDCAMFGAVRFVGPWATASDVIGFKYAEQPTMVQFALAACCRVFLAHRRNAQGTRIIRKYSAREICRWREIYYPHQ